MSQRELSGRLARWSLSLQGFDFKIEHCQGKHNIVPDALSRLHASELCEVHLADDDDTDIAPLHLDLESSEFSSLEYLALIDILK